MLQKSMHGEYISVILFLDANKISAGEICDHSPTTKQGQLFELECLQFECLPKEPR